MGHRQRLTPAIVAGVVLLAVVLLIDRPAATSDDEPANSADPPQTAPAAQLDSYTEPDDLSDAEAVAAEFTQALLAGDLAALEALTTSGFGEQLSGPQARAEPAGTDGAAVDAIIPRDLHADRVTLQVVIRHTDQPVDRLEAVTLSLVRTDGGGWRVADGAI